MDTNIKKEALRLIERMPEDATLEDIMYSLYFRERVDRGLAQADAGQTVSHEEVMRKVAEWLQSAGR